MSQDYIRVARAKGLLRRVIMMRHALPNALLPVVTLGGLAYAQLLTGTVLTETIFSWPGLGRYTFQSAVILDFPAIMGITLVVAIVYVMVNLLVDVSYAMLDPRVMRPMSACRPLLAAEAAAGPAASPAPLAAPLRTGCAGAAGHRGLGARRDAGSVDHALSAERCECGRAPGRAVGRPLARNR